jgi:hypothetical protein
MIGDIVKVYQSSPTKLLVQIMFRVTKGNPNWDHVVTIEGNPYKSSNTDAVFYLEQHLKSVHRCSLLDIATWSKELKAKKLYAWTKESMRYEVYTYILCNSYLHVFIDLLFIDYE